MDYQKEGEIKKWEVDIIDLHNCIGYNFDDLEYNELRFYTKDDDDDFMGVDVVKTLNY